MKGIILSGASGERLRPITLGIPKQLIPIYNKPMIFYPLEMLVKLGIKDILVITTADEQPLFRKALGDGNSFGCRLSYEVQQYPNGIAEAIHIACNFIGSDSVCLITGDTIIEAPDFERQIHKAVRAADKSGSATIFVESKTYEGQYGRVLLDKNLKISNVIGESDAPFYYSIASLYTFPKNVIKYASDLKPSERGLFEITEVNKRYFLESKLLVQVLDSKCKWFDTNTFENILQCAEYMKKKSMNNK